MSKKVKTTIDIIYVNFNSSVCLIKSLYSLYKYNCGMQLNIIVFDNFSTDNSFEIKKIFPDIRYIRNKKNIGFGAAINQSLRYCYSEFIILLNPDSYLSDEFISFSVKFMKKNSKIGVMGPMILDEDGSIQGSARAFPTPLTSLFGRNSPITKIFPKNSITRKNILTIQSDGHTPIDVDWVSGACMIVRRKVLQAVGGFDERFFLYWEDTDLCCRIRRNGWKVVYNPSTKVIHSVGKSSDTRPVFANYQFHKSCYRLYEKYATFPFYAFVPIAGFMLLIRFIIVIIFAKLGNLSKHFFNKESQVENNKKNFYELFNE